MNKQNEGKELQVMSLPSIAIAQPHLRKHLFALSERYNILSVSDDGEVPRATLASVLVTVGNSTLDPTMLDTMPALKFVACLTVGFEGIDLEYMKRRDIAVTHAVDASSEDVADHVIGAIIAHRRGFMSGDAMVRSGSWKPADRPPTKSLAGARVGIVGLGNIGRRIAQRAEAMRMVVQWWGPRSKPDVVWPRALDLYALAQWCDVLVIAAEAHKENSKMISEEIVAVLGHEGLLINVARGSLLDEECVRRALRNGTLGAAALDVFDEEPTPASVWDGVPNCLLTPHTAGVTDAALRELQRQLDSNLYAFFNEKHLTGRLV